MIPVQVSINKNDIIFKTGDESVIYKTDVNAFIADTGLTIQNIMLPLISKKVFYMRLADQSSTFTCGNTLDNILLELEKEIDNGLIIIDFDEVEEVSESFFKKYIKFLLTTSNKVITINMNVLTNQNFSAYVAANILYDDEEEDE